MIEAAARKSIRPHDWLSGGGEMGKLVRSIDWSRAPLGSIDSWPQSLRTTVSLCLASNFPLCVVWGASHTQIYNDGYWPICGAKHPHSMGQDFTECWASAWPVIGVAFERALTGETSFLEDQRMFLDRNGYLEEAFFTFSFSPILDESGGVGGVFHPVTETTQKMLAERRTGALRDLAVRVAKGRTWQETLSHATEKLTEFSFDIPFALFYAPEQNGKHWRLVAGTVADSLPIAASADAGHMGLPGLPLSEVFTSCRPAHVRDFVERCGSLAWGPYPEPPKEALLLPILTPGSERPIAILVVGVSPRLSLNEEYRSFYDFVAATVSSAVANALAREEEVKRMEALAEIDRAKTVFFSNISHEFRTPLTLMLGPLQDELAAGGDCPLEARRERVATAYRNSLRLQKLVDSLLDFSRLEAGRIQAMYEPTDLAQYTAELVSMFRSAIEKGGVSLVVHCPTLPEPVYVDKDMWQKIVLNLISNAFKHTFSGTITASLEWRNDHVELQVSDTGVGIPATDLPNIFNRFYRVKGAASRTHEGTGIGLALVHDLADMHGGSVHVVSHEGVGTTFTVKIKSGYSHLPQDRVGPAQSDSVPIARGDAYVLEASQWISETSTDAAQSSLTPDAIDDLETGGAPGRSAKACLPRILWVDDNADMRAYVGSILAKHYDVTPVGNGLLALESARAAPPDLVLSDVMMPGLDGFGLLRAFREQGSLRMIPFILLSARAGEEASLEGLNAGADDYLVKPFSARELLARVKTHLELARLRHEYATQLEQQVESRTAELLRSCQELSIEVRERQEAERKMHQTLKERETLIQEVHHRVKNNMQVMSSLINMQMRTLEGKSGRPALQECQFRIQTMALVHEQLYQSADYSNVRLSDYFKSLADSIFSGSNTASTGITLELELQEVSLPVDRAIPCGLILNELMTNALKHAFPSIANGILRVELRKEPNEQTVLLSVTDNGVGISSAQPPERADSMGISLVRMLVEQLKGRLEFVRQSGTSFRVSFPVV